MNIGLLKLIKRQQHETLAHDRLKCRDAVAYHNSGSGNEIFALWETYNMSIVRYTACIRSVSTGNYSCIDSMVPAIVSNYSLPAYSLYNFYADPSLIMY